MVCQPRGKPLSRLRKTRSRALSCPSYCTANLLDICHHYPREPHQLARAWRTRLIYQTNLRTSYMAGRWETLQKFPYLQYQHRTVDNPRENHKALDDKIIATRDPWWDTHYPPNGWMCRCTVNGISEARLRAMRGENAEPDTAPPTDPNDPPPEWRYHVGKAARSMAAAERFGQKVMQLPPAWRKAALDDAQKRQVDWFKDFPGFIDRAVSEIAEGKPRSVGAVTPVAFMPNQVWEQLAAGETIGGYKFQPKRVTPLIASSDRALYHAMRGGQKWEGREEALQLVIAEARNLPVWANHPDTLWFLNKSPFQLVLARKLDDTRYMTVPISLDEIDHKAKKRVKSNWLHTFEVETPNNMKHLKLLYGNP
ncbi:hypothetical protein CO608_00210 [Lysobacteraceae bacterium NML08-0793]|nr:hypothetical protein CO608_00210 [Xanthomonadaceae bacterium NML08-0793]